MVDSEFFGGLTRLLIMLFRDHNESIYSDFLQTGKYVVRIVDTDRTLDWFPIYEDFDHDLIISVHGKKKIYYLGESGTKYKMLNGSIRKIGGKGKHEYKCLKHNRIF